MNNYQIKENTNLYKKYKYSITSDRISIKNYTIKNHTGIIKNYKMMKRI